MKLVAINSQKTLREWWPFVRDGLVKTIAKTETRYLPEDVYAAILAGNAALYLIGVVGFVVVQLRKDVDGQDLHIWWLWCPAAEQMQDELQAALDELARACKCARITAEGRKGFGRIGFMREVSRTFEREVSNA